jgi:hypothetical protein
LLWVNLISLAETQKLQNQSLSPSGFGVVQPQAQANPFLEWRDNSTSKNHRHPASFRRRSHPRYQRQTSAEPLARLVHLQTLAAREAAQIAPYIWWVPVTEVSEAEDKFWVVW